VFKRFIAGNIDYGDESVLRELISGLEKTIE
jgi:hypothetical protein